LAIPEEEWDDFMNDGSRWNDRGLSRALEEHLGSGHVPFLALLDRFRQSVLKFAVSLDLDPAQDFKPRYLAIDGSKTSFFSRLSRKSNRLFTSLDIGLNNRRLVEELKQMEMDLSRLQSLSQADELRRKPAATLPERSAEGLWDHVREAVNVLFRALSGRWKCKCRHLHRAYLRLDSREATRTGQSLLFRLTLFSDHCPRDPSPWRCRTIEVESRSTDGLTTPGSPTAAIKVADNPKYGSEKRVRISDIVPTIDLVDSKFAAIKFYSTPPTPKARVRALTKPHTIPTATPAVVDCLCMALHQRKGQYTFNEEDWQYRFELKDLFDNRAPMRNGSRPAASTQDPWGEDAVITSKPLFEQLLLASSHPKWSSTRSVRQK
jgi:hypothetical protein